jgi:hypothetical protein
MNQLSSLYVFMLCVIVGMGGMLKVMGGKLSGYMAIGVAMAVHVVNCASVGLLSYAVRPARNSQISCQRGKLASVLREWRLYAAYSRNSPRTFYWLQPPQRQ